MPSKSPQSEPEEEFTSAMRIVGGVSWGTLLTLLIGSTLILIPQVPRPWLWSIPAIWTVLSGLGIGLQWNVARGSCPKCGYQLSVPSTGRRCPQCKSYLQAMNRKITRL
ncbi:MAG: hypothetical protein AAGB13_19425 [Cyanobacteria bacterium P01_F01_bin.33]